MTGHRDIAPKDEDAIRRLVGDRIRELKRAYPSTPLMALSGLAEGADMVFAEVALDLGFELIAVLPAPPDVFVKDFECPAHGDRNASELALRFRVLLEQSADVVVVAEHLPEHDPRRYALVGAYLARHCNILFALWDGVETNTEGATSHVVRMAHEGVPNEYRETPQRVLNAPEPKQVHHLRVHRVGNMPLERFEWSLIRREPLEPYVDTETMAAINRFNADAAALTANDPNAVTQTRNALGVGLSLLSRSERRILEVFAVADALAILLQRHSLWSLNTVFWIGWFMVLAFEVYAHMWGLPYILGVYILGLLTGWAIYHRDRKSATYTRFLDYRGLAEGLRVQLFWRLSGLSSSAANHYLRKQFNELSWIRVALRVLNIGPRRSEPLTQLVRQHWIEDQAGYFENSCARRRESLHWYEKRARICFIAGIVVACLGLVIELIFSPHVHETGWMRVLILLMGLLPATAGILSGYVERRGLGQHAKQYERMKDIFRRAADIVYSKNLANDPDAFKRLIEDLGEEALSENADWIILHRERPIKLPER